MKQIKSFILIFLVFSSSFGQIQTEILQSGIDAIVSRWGANTNYGNHANNFAYTNTTNMFNPYILKSYIEFDLSNVPDRAIIESVTLRLKEDTTYSPREIMISLVGSDWIESQITWNNQPSIIAGQDLYYPALTTTTGYYEYDITTLGKKWLEEGQANHGIRFQQRYESVGATLGYRYFSFENSTPNNRPNLIVKYYDPIDVAGTVVHSTGNDGSVTANVTGGDGVYSYTWRDGSGQTIGGNSPSLSGLTDGFYTLSIVDGKGNTGSQIFLVTHKCDSKNYELTLTEDFTRDSYLDNRYPYTPNINTNLLGAGQYQYGIIGGGTGVSDFTSIIDITVIGLENAIISKAYFKLKLNSLNTISSSNIYITPLLENWSELDLTPDDIFNLNFPQHSTNSIDFKFNSGTINGYDYFDLTTYFEINKAQMHNLFGFKFEENYSGMSVDHFYKYYGSNHSTYPPKLEIEVSKFCTHPFAKLHDKFVSDYFFIKAPNDKLRIHYDEEYFPETGELTYSITNLNDDSHYSQADYPVEINYGNNWIEIDLGSTGLNLTPSADYYTLTVVNDKNEKKYLRFKYSN